MHWPWTSEAISRFSPQTLWTLFGSPVHVWTSGSHTKSSQAPGYFVLVATYPPEAISKHQWPTSAFLNVTGHLKTEQHWPRNHCHVNYNGENNHTGDSSVQPSQIFLEFGGNYQREEGRWEGGWVHTEEGISGWESARLTGEVSWRGGRRLSKREKRKPWKLCLREERK